MLNLIKKYFYAMTVIIAIYLGVIATEVFAAKFWVSRSNRKKEALVPFFLS